jgi:hypothetical protein
MASGSPCHACLVTDSGLTSPADLDAVAIVSALNERGVRYVVIGAFAAIAQQAPIAPTRDIDFTPDTAIANLRRLSSALTDLDARIRTDAADGGLPFDHNGASLGRAAVWNLICRHIG